MKEKEMLTPLATSHKLFAAFERNNILYCHWKSNEHLLEGLAGDTDLDVLVSENDSDKASVLLSECGYKKAIIQFGSRYPKVEEWIGFDEETGRLIHIHLHYEIVTGMKHQKDYVLPWADRVLSQRVLNSQYQVYTASKELELILLKTRNVLKMPYSKRIKLALGQGVNPSGDYSSELDYLLQDADKEKVLSAANELYGDSTLHAYWLSDHYDNKELKTAAHRIRKKLAPYRRYPEIVVAIKYLYFRIAFAVKKILNKLRIDKPVYRKELRKPGLLIAFIGPDGCGKSTVTSEVEKWLTWKIEASRFYLGSGDHFNSIGKRLLSLLKKTDSRVGASAKSGNAGKGQVQIKPAEGKKVPLKKHLGHIYDSFYLISIAKHCLRELVRADRYRKKGGIALLDRFPQTQFEGINDGPKIACKYGELHNTLFFRFMAKLEYSIFRRISQIQPDVVIKLMVSPEESIRRKPDHNYEEVSRKSEVVKNLLFSNSSVYTVDTEQAFGSELKQIKKIIWDELNK